MATIRMIGALMVNLVCFAKILKEWRESEMKFDCCLMELW